MIPAIILGGHLAVAVADRLPELNIEQACREATTGETRKNEKFEVCIADEKRVRDQLAAQWSSFDPAARTRCARESASGRAASYLELLVCFELDQADRAVHGQGSTPGLTIMTPKPPVGEPDEPTDSNQRRPGPNASPGRPAPVAVPTRPASVAAPTKPAPIPRSLQQPAPRSTAASPVAAPPASPLPAEPPPAEPLTISPAPPTVPQSTSQTEVLHQSFCRSPFGYVLPGCR